MPKLFQIPVISGGRLITNISQNMVGPSDMVIKTNWVRQRDQEARRNGWVAFSPIAAIGAQDVFDATLTCIKLVELIRGDGTKAIVGFSRSSVKLFDNTLGTWSTIGSGYSASGKRWQTVMINGTLVANNAVDLPFYWNIGDTAVTPMYELREVGVASVGRIAENNSFLIIADITEIRAAQLDHWMNGYSSYVSGGNTAKAASFTALVGETTRTYQVTTGATNMVATLPAVAVAGYAVALFYRIEKMDAGAGIITTSPVIEDYAVSLDSIGDMALVWWDIVLGKWSAVTFPNGTVPATAPYGIPSSAIDITERLPWAIANSEYGIPDRWAPVFSVYMAAASATIVLPFASSVFLAGRTRVAVVNGGPLNGTLGGQEATPTGVMVTAVSGATLTLQVTTDVDITYPRVVQILRWEDVSSLVGQYLIQGDNSAITSLATLRDWLVVFRETGIYLGRYTGDPGAPFVFTPKYSGSNVPLWPDAIANIKSDYLLYPARGNRVYKFDGVTWPEIHEVTDMAANLFFVGYDQADEIFCVENTITKEIWWCFPDKTVGFDFDTPGGTVSVLEQNFDAAAVVHKTNTTDVWFIMAIGRHIKTYGLVYGITPIATWWRTQEWVERTAAAANSWKSVAWSPTLGMFAAVATSGAGNRVMTSTNGVTWTIRVSAADYSWSSIVWGAGLFVAVASSGGTTDRVMTSPDGITWTLRTTPNHGFTGLVFGGGLFVAVGSAVTMTSPDGITWTDRTNATTFLSGVAYGAGLYVAVSSLGDVTTSPDGITWTLRVAPAGTSAAVAWSSALSLFAAVGNAIKTSPDGINWTLRTMPEANTWTAIATNAMTGLFVAVASSGNNRVMFSPDGVTWYVQSEPDANSWNGITWSPALGIFAAVASSGTFRVMTSDGEYVAESVMRFGLNSFGDQSSEKLCLNFTPILSSSSPDVELEVQICTTHNPSAAIVAFLSPVESLPTPQGNNFVTLALQAIYVQDEITLVETADIDARFSLRIWEVEVVGGKGVTRSIN